MLHGSLNLHAAHCSLSACRLPGSFSVLAHLDSAEYSRTLEVQDSLERVRVQVSRPGAEVVEPPEHRVRHEERVVLEEKVLVLVHAFRAEDANVAAGNGPQQVRLFAPAVFLLEKKDSPRLGGSTDISDFSVVTVRTPPPPLEAQIGWCSSRSSFSAPAFWTQSSLEIDSRNFCSTDVLETIC